ncbi:MAG TPA: helix-turn-helix transcriptional regulator [Beijerinckiaceae bacterium]|jgi:DNA-binding transcriptional ArsR family regulator|nr:helix-turn-helix transcriptional regulator [Beijerinckiaceae bacterium]
MARSGVDIAEIASLMGDVARAHMLAALMDGRALTALELALTARVTPQTASSHLAKLREANLLTMEKQGRHRYFRLASPRVAEALESVLTLAGDGPPRHRPPTRIDAEMRTARTCYDHVAGVLGVGVTDSLVARGHVAIEDDAGEVTPSGVDFLTRLGVDLTPRQKSRRIFCRPCLDWSERRPHLAGHVGAALCAHFLNVDWVRRTRESRALKITPLGREKFAEVFGVVLQETGATPRVSPAAAARLSPSPRAGAHAGSTRYSRSAARGL